MGCGIEISNLPKKNAIIPTIKISIVAIPEEDEESSNGIPVFIL